MTELTAKNSAINIIRKKKEIYYSLFTVVLSFLIYFLIAALIDVADSQPIFPFFLLFFNFKGIPFEIIHESLFFLSAVIGALFFFIVLEYWLPELFVMIYYLYRLISQKVCKKR